MTDGQFNLQQYNIMWQGKLLGTFQGATYAQSDWHFAVNDWLGTKRVITNSDGSYSTSFYSGPFGDFQTQFGAGSDPSDQHFTSKERDQESGNDYFGARYYASNFGRFMSPDWSKNPQGVPYADFTNPQSLNLYSYVSNNPLSKTDPSGHCDANGQNCSIWDHIAGAVGGVLNIVPQTINLTNSIVNSAISPFTSYQFPMLDTIHPDTHTSAVGLQTGSALQMTLPLAGSAGGAALSEAAEAELGGTALARQLGQAGEDSVGITGPKTAIEIAGSGQIRIPDALTDTTLTEVKNVGSLSYTQQLQDFTTYSQANGLNFELWVRPSTQLSGPLQQAIANGQITLRFIPGAP